MAALSSPARRSLLAVLPTKRVYGEVMLIQTESQAITWRERIETLTIAILRLTLAPACSDPGGGVVRLQSDSQPLPVYHALSHLLARYS